MSVATDPLMAAVGQQQGAARKTAWRRYLALLEKKGDPTSSDAGVMANLMHELGKSAEDVFRDRQTLELLRRQEGVVRNGSGLDHDTQAAHQAVEENEPKMRAAIVEAQRHHNELRAAVEHLQGMTHSARDAVNEVRKL